MIDRLLHIANSCPPRSKAHRDRFYAMKQRILRWFGTEDGYDLQHIEGKRCGLNDGLNSWSKGDDHNSRMGCNALR